MLKLVVDLSVWLDLCYAQLLEEFTRLPADILVSDAQLGEIEKEKGLDLDPYLSRLSSQSYTPSEMTTAQEMVAKYPQLSAPDVLAFLLAERTGATLITGDKNLRKLANSKRVDCHGTLWILDTLLEHETITAEIACLALQSMLAENSFLPRLDVLKRLDKWCPEERD